MSFWDQSVGTWAETPMVITDAEGEGGQKTDCQQKDLGVPVGKKTKHSFPDTRKVILGPQPSCKRR